MKYKNRLAAVLAGILFFCCPFSSLAADGQRDGIGPDIPVTETVEAALDIPMVESIEADLDIPVAEIVEADLDKPVTETVEADLDMPVTETVETDLDMPVTETVEADRDMPVTETVEADLDTPEAEPLQADLDMLEPEPARDTGSSRNVIPSPGRILDHIYLGSLDLSGMTGAEAMQAAEKRMEEISGYQILLRMDDQSAAVSAKELGVSGKNQEMIEYAAGLGQSGSVLKRYKIKKDLENQPRQLPFQYQADPEMIRTALQTYCVPLNREVSNYGLVRENGAFRIISGQRGVTLLEDESVQLVENYLTNIWKDGIGDLELAVEITEPKGSLEELSRVKDILGQGSTDYSSSGPARVTNVQNGTRKLNGKVLYPGESFSVCNAMMPFTEENGYELAASYSNGEVVESFGGGICQVSTTLYLAVLRSELEVTERHNHSMLVNYVKPSMDAAIAEGAKDFQFVNNLDAPIYIEGYAGGGTIGFVIYGEEYRPEGRSVTYQSETLEMIDPGTELTADETKAFGAIEQTQSAHTGCVAKLWKIVTENGEETKEEVNNSSYQMTPNKYAIGVKTSNAEAASAMYNAIAANDLNEVYAVWSQYSG